MYPISVYISMIDVVTSLICLLYHQSCPDPNISRRETSVGNHWDWDLSLWEIYFIFLNSGLSLPCSLSVSLFLSLICTLRVYPSVSVSLFVSLSLALSLSFSLSAFTTRCYQEGLIWISESEMKTFAI